MVVCVIHVMLFSVRHRWRQYLASTHQSVTHVQWEMNTGEISYMERIYFH
jgi:hypothetical protein